MPQNVEGMRTDPAPSVPTASGPIPDATAAAAPPDEPPGVIFVFQGFRVMPVRKLSVVPLMPNSGVLVLPSKMAPASRNRAVTGASMSHGCCGSMVRDPRNVGQPRVRIRSLIDTGTPSRMSIGAFFCQRASDARALASAPSASTMQNAFSNGSRPEMRASTARAASTGEARPDRYSPRSCVAVQSARLLADECTGFSFEPMQPYHAVGVADRCAPAATKRTRLPHGALASRLVLSPCARGRGLAHGGCPVTVGRGAPLRGRGAFGRPLRSLVPRRTRAEPRGCAKPPGSLPADPRPR